MNLEKSWELRVKESVYKTLSKFPGRDNARLTDIIERLADDPHHGDIEKMKGKEETWRRRVGAYRIFYEIIPGRRIIFIFRVERRASKTY